MTDVLIIGTLLVFGLPALILVGMMFLCLVTIAASGLGSVAIFAKTLTWQPWRPPWAGLLDSATRDWLGT
jgi:hypothetical protein